MNIPNYKNRSAESILSDTHFFQSSGYIYRALSWIDFAKRKGNPVAFQYGAHDARQGIEQLLFEELVLSVGDNFDRNEYEKCLGNSTKLHAIINRLAPNREKLAKFNRAIFSVGNNQIDLIVYDHKKLMKYWGQLSNYLHWPGAIDETIMNESWVEEGIRNAEEACLYIWGFQTKAVSGIILPENMNSDIRALWERYKNDNIGIEDVKRSYLILEPVIR